MDDAGIFEVVRSNVCTVLPEVDPAAVTIDTALVDLGCNSLDRTEVVAMSMEDLDVEVPAMAFQGVSDIRSLVTVLRRYTG